MEAFTPRGAAKFVVKATIQLKTAQFVKDTAADHTRFEKDDTVVNITSGVVAWYVADKLKPYTDKMVDKAADKIVDYRAKKAAKKDPPSE